MARSEHGSGTPARASSPGTLFVVATPIGNLEDITLRALRVLREVELIAAEDTRRTRHLLTHYGIASKLISLHEHNERARIPTVLSRLAAGASVALVTDAGTPGASDPGMLLVRAAREQSIRVEAIPGPSALLAALSVAGEPFESFVFLGFPPTRSKDRKRWFARIATIPDPVVFFEAPHRVRATISDLEAFVVERPIIMCRELTKLHEEVLTGRPEALLARLQEPRGEFTFVLGAISRENRPAIPADPALLDLAIADELGQSTEISGESKRDRLRRIAERFGVKVGDVYRAAEKLKTRS